MLIVKPPDVVVDGLTFYCDSIFFVIFFRQLPSKLSERNSTKTYQVCGSWRDFKMRAKNLGYPLS